MFNKGRQLSSWAAGQLSGSEGLVLVDLGLYPILFRFNCCDVFLFRVCFHSQARFIAGISASQARYNRTLKGAPTRSKLSF